MVLTNRLLAFSRGYATTRAGGSRLKPTLSLDQFIQRGRVLAFYRTILRGTKKIPDPTTRAESRRYARDEFERRRNVTDAAHVRYLLSVGKTEWEGMERYIDASSPPSRDVPSFFLNLSEEYCKAPSEASQEEENVQCLLLVLSRMGVYISPPPV
ncbi:hypothetical protein FLAG1_01284 [Fusarium langsethiae]|uniref:LYR motif-containing protein 2 n=1 Tax=Fusarium langsethiae TaxID=179993 RepID=A0A0N0V8E7_FUSLA|nr:hypothetical protein FLAG1_01284 [Fusarium langsethiae]